ncbi:MAG: cell division protein ZapA [Proteobacteria bacterium]|nr:cell division protein ZapA [Pseudomonadota bacterium]
MAVLNVRINGKHYEVACDDGQEDHLRQLADEVDERMRRIVRGMGNALGEPMAFLLTALTMADEIIENRRENQEIAQEVQRLANIVNDDKRGEQEGRMVEIEHAMATTLEEIALRIEKIADQIEIR